MRKIFISAIICLSVLSAVLLGELVVVSLENDNNKKTIESVYKSSVYSLSDSLDNLKVNMSKLMVASGTEDDRMLLTETYRHAETAAESASRLPVSQENISASVKFFNQIGDWSLSYIKAISEKKDTARFKESADKIYAAAGTLSEKVHKIELDIEEKGIFSSIGENRIFPYDLNLNLGETHNSIDFPALIYDGPFSDGKEYRFAYLEKLNEISEEQAVKIAKEKFGIDAESVSLNENKTSVYHVMGKKGDRDVYLALSKKGGVPLTYSLDVQSEGEIMQGEAEAIVVDFMENIGFSHLVPVWYNSIGDTAHINLAPKADGIIYYTDLVKVKVNADGTVSGFESSGYCEKNKTRRLIPALGEADALARVSDKLAVKSVRLVVIPSGDEERLCYEVAGKYSGLDYFVYIDAMSGAEAEIMRVVNGDQGTLVM